ncbi:myosin heavy chain, clone 203-like isoform X1 [Centruroides vittatus]|uniref:myosin heavy chain, clone 203-like isoform X1 n=1 Tax=Centruroides vittatus TaxID=120091 RepID=UPI0035106BE5
MFGKYGSEEALNYKTNSKENLEGSNADNQTPSNKENTTQQQQSIRPLKPPRRKYSLQTTSQKETECTTELESNLNISNSLSPKIINSDTEQMYVINSQHEDINNTAENENIFNTESNYFDSNSAEYFSVPKHTISDQNLSWDRQYSSLQEVLINGSLSKSNLESKSMGSTPLHSLFHTNSFTSSCHNVFSPETLYFTSAPYHSSSGVHSLPPFIQSYSPRESSFERLNRKEEKYFSKETFYDKLRNDNFLNSIVAATNNLKLPCHRRHHSDPVLSWDNKLTKKSMVRTASQRSHSFIGPSPNKAFNKLSMENLKNQHYLGGIKDPILLSAEVKALREINEKLWQHLHSVQSQLDILQKFKHVSKSDMSRPTQFADLLAEIYYAQKERDQAMQARLRLMMQERDTAVNQLQQLLKCLGSDLKQESDSSDEDEIEESLQNGNDFLKMNLLSHQGVDKLLRNLEATQSPVKLMHQKEILLANVYRARDHRKHRLSHELRVILAERDAAIEKARSLEEELLQWRHSNSLWQADTKQWESNLLDTLRQVITERDTSIAKVNELEEKLRLCYHLQASLIGVNNQQGISEIEQLDVFQKTESSQESTQKGFGETSLITSLLQSNLNNEEKSHLQNEMSTLSLQLESEKKAREIAEEKYQKLERLVNVLQKKVNGLSVGVSV